MWHASPGPTTRDQVFTYVAPTSVHSVTVAGTFNNWNKSANPMALESDGRTWSTKLSLPYGRVQYKFVIDDSTWIVDPSAKSVSDGNGNLNSTLLIVPPDFDRPASPNDGVIAQSALLHNSNPSFLNYDRGRLTFRLRTRANDVAHVDLQIRNQPFQPMQQIDSDDLYATYETSVPWNRAKSLSYRFRLQDGQTKSWFGPSGLTDSTQDFYELDAKTYRPFEVPGWVEKSVIYQIFPDRFANGDPSNDPKDVQPWNGKPTYSNRFGGDVAGVRQHLDYLQALGISAVYFTPVFASPSNHRYDTTDYRKIDPQFGTNQEFHDLTQDMDRRGIRTIMDFALNHTATNFGAFLDVERNGPNSPYKNWYFIKSYPVVVKQNPPYVAWFNYPSMPKLNVLNPPTHDYLLGSVAYWLQNAPGLSGLRLDTANEVDMRFWRDLRNTVKPSSPDVWIVGEVWTDASAWLQGDQWDAAMDYPFRDACVKYFAQNSVTTSQFLSLLELNLKRYAPQVSRNMMNLLSSHDTARFLTLCHDDVALDELATTVQFSWVGTPSVYYGEEIGMEGGADPDNRRPMDWANATPENPLLAWYRKLVRIRNTNPALQSGDLRVLESDDNTNTFAFSRELPDDLDITVVNRSDREQTVSVPLPQTSPYRAAIREGFLDLLSGRRISASGHVLTVTLKAMSSQILRPNLSPVKTAARQSSRSVSLRPTLHPSL